jgi:coenzyme F420-0:L-glutamate ligase / coenzyme F420-1:gamma-L-glutamate ligase
VLTLALPHAGDIITRMITDAIHTRRSIRRYTEQPVPPELIDRLLEAAIHAPSSHNRQPWRFVVITTSDMKTQLADRMGERLKADRLRAADRAEDIDRDIARSRTRITSAPALIVVCLSTIHLNDHYERLMAIQSVAASIENLLLAAHEAGLGACWMAAPLYCPDVVREVLQLPDDWEAQALITIGYPADANAGKSKVDFRDITIYR